ncbi:MAG: DUF971 domain-containing protein [Planctomycetota bacterium]|nr:MAG: DUF971 domain-containing protein [Planctomycetota bacterium]
MERRLIGLARLADGLRLSWDDGLEARIGFRDLRLECPCAHCVSEVTGRRLLDPATVPEDLGLQDMKPVGNYAYRCLFSDGHDSGIYPLELLRALSEESARGVQARR